MKEKDPYKQYQLIGLVPVFIRSLFILVRPVYLCRDHKYAIQRILVFKELLSWLKRQNI